MIAVSNASPLIYLSKIGAISLLSKIFRETFTSTIVKDEVLEKKDVPEYLVLVECFSTWLKVKNPRNESLIKNISTLGIHLGEATVIALAKEIKINEKETIIILDDLAARDMAKTFGMTITGTVGVLLKALDMNLINKNECKHFLYELIQYTTFRIGAEVYSKLIKKIDEY